MKDQRTETTERGFDQLWTSPQFEKLRNRIIRLFARRGCVNPEDLADETISRVMAKLPEVAPTYEGDPHRFFYAVARKVYLEYARRPRTVPFVENLDRVEMPGDEEPPAEKAYDCLETCMGQLGPEDRRLIGEYYRYDKDAKIDRRKELAAELGIGMNVLRIKAYRIRRRLSACVLRCLGIAPPAEMKDSFPHNEA